VLFETNGFACDMSFYFQHLNEVFWVVVTVDLTALNFVCFAERNGM